MSVSPKPSTRASQGEQRGDSTKKSCFAPHDHLGARSALTASGFASRQYCVRLLRGVCSLVLVALIVGLTPAAYVEPPDPSWLGGYWDDDDFDNVVAFIASTCAIAVLCTVDAGPLWAPVARVEPCEPNAAPAPLRSVASSRAPPVSFPPYSD